MADHERRMLAFSRLAAESKSRGQSSGYVRFLLLAGIAAARAGHSQVAQHCRDLIVASAPQHLLASYKNLESALRDEEFQPFVQHLDRFCSFERAELLLDEMHLAWETVDDAGEKCLVWLKDE